MNRRIALLAVIALGILLTVALLLRRERHEATRVVRVGFLPIIASLPLYVAREEGLFREAGVTVELVEFSDSNRLSDALATGTLDVAPTVALAPMANLESSFPGRIRVFSVSRMTKNRPFDSILVKRGSSAKSITDMAGRKIGTFPGTTATALLGHFLETKGVASSGVSIIPLAPPNQIPALDSGSIDALHAYEPTLSYALSRGYRKIEGSIYAALHEPAPIGCSAISRKFEQENPELSARFLSAFDKAVEFIRNEPGNARKILSAAGIAPPGAAERCSLLNLSLSTEDATSDIDAYLNILRMVEEAPRSITADDLTKSSKDSGWSRSR